MTAGPAARAGGDDVAAKIANQAEITSRCRRRTGQVNRQVTGRRHPMRAFYSAAALAAVLTLGIVPGANAEPSGKLTVSVIGVRSDSGAVRCGLYSSPAGFREPGHELRGAVAQITLCLQRASGRDLRGRGVPRGTQRDADGNRLVRQAEAGLRLLQQSRLDLRTAELQQRGVRVQGWKPEPAGAAELLAPGPTNPAPAMRVPGGMTWIRVPGGMTCMHPERMR